MYELSTNQQEQIIQAANNAAYSVVRERYLLGGNNLNTKHCNMYKEFGWVEDPQYTDLKKAYDTIAAANGVIKAINNGSFQTIPCVIEGDIESEDTERTDWEKLVDKLIRKMWMRIKDGDKLNLIGRYSGLILVVAEDDGRKLSEPLTSLPSIDSLVDIIPASELQLRVSSYYSSASDGLLYGQPKIYNFDEYLETDKSTQGAGQPSKSEQIHASRVILLNEGAIGNSFDGESILRPIYNNLLDIQKITGSDAEGRWKNAARQIAISYDKDTDMSQVMRSSGVDPADKNAAKLFKETMASKLAAMSTGTDSAMYGMGYNTQILSVAMEDPEKSVEVQMNMISLSIGRSLKGLMGSQTGERASAEDAKKDAKADMERQSNFVSQVLTNLVNRLIDFGAIDSPKGGDFYWKWPNLLEMTEKERLENMKIISEVAERGAKTFMQSPVSMNEIRAAGGLEADDKYEDDEVAP